MGLLRRVSGQARFEQVLSEIEGQADAVAARGGGLVEFRKSEFPIGSGQLAALTSTVARHLAGRGFIVERVEISGWNDVARVYVKGLKAQATNATEPTTAVADPMMRCLVRMATTKANYGAVQDAYQLARRLAPPNAELWSWWLDGIEALAAHGDPDIALYVKFARDAGYIEPWGDLPDGANERLNALTAEF